MKKVGHLLEGEYSEKLNLLQIFLVEICKDPAVDIILRLNILEIIELRSLNWRSNPTLEHFYEEKKAQIEERKNVFYKIQQVKSKNSARSNTEEDDKLKFQTSVQDLFPDTKLRKRECLVVDKNDVKEKLFLSSTNYQLVKDAKSCLSEYFSFQSREVSATSESNV